MNGNDTDNNTMNDNDIDNNTMRDNDINNMITDEPHPHSPLQQTHQ